MVATRKRRADALRPRGQSGSGGIRAGPSRGVDPRRRDDPGLRMSLRVLEPGLHSVVVDAGRPRSRSLGVPVGGAADRFSLAIGNALVGNPADAAALEVCLNGPVLQADEDLACVLFGAPFELSAGQQNLAAGKTFTLLAEIG